MEQKAMIDLIKLREKETGHSVYGPSSLPRIVECPASVGDSLLCSVGKTSSYALHGTMLHQCVEMVMAKGVDWLYEPAQSHLAVGDIYAVIEAVDYSKEIRALYPKDARVYQEAPTSMLTWGLPEIEGTCDYAVFGNHTVDVIDYKFGSGVKVFAKDNWQGLGYGAGIVGYPSNIKEINIHICQPFLNHFDVWTLSMDKMKELIFGELTEAVENSKGPAPRRVPGKKQCRFCPAGFTCKARHQQALEDAATIFTAHEKLQELSKDELADALDSADRYSDYIKALRIFAQQEIEHGRGFPRRKLVAGRSLRKWASPKEVVEYLKKMDVPEVRMYAPRKLVSPAQAEKLDIDFKKDEEFKSLWVKGSGKPQLVNESDPRPSLAPTADAGTAFSGVEVISK